MLECCFFEGVTVTFLCCVAELTAVLDLFVLLVKLLCGTGCGGMKTERGLFLPEPVGEASGFCWVLALFAGRGKIRRHLSFSWRGASAVVFFEAEDSRVGLWMRCWSFLFLGGVLWSLLFLSF